MFHHGFFALFLIIALAFGFITMIFSIVFVLVFNGKKKVKKKEYTLADLRAEIPKAKTLNDALGLIEEFQTKFRNIKPDLKEEWLNTLAALVSVESVDIDKVAEIRERFIRINPNFKAEITECVGTVLKTKKDKK